eukprot:Lithocolla_globosa_v1_NODE_1719_length_2380_cov_8.299785.p1 type:complete len:374 gc:universal NODE_1719_length_2380_cov_8.299785:2323-1202(-)
MALFGLFLLGLASAGDVWLSSGYGGWTRQRMDQLYNDYQFYYQGNMTTHSSLLMYFFTTDGHFDHHENHNTPQGSVKPFAQALKSEIGLKAYPCFFCDETIGECSGLNSRLEAIYRREAEFIADTITEAKVYGWDGYTVDIESFGRLDSERLTTFLINWGVEMMNNGMTLQLWVGGPSQYNMGRLNDSPYVFPLQTMDTYRNSYSSWESAANSFLNQVHAEKAGFGLLVSHGLKDLMDSLVAYGADRDLVMKKYGKYIEEDPTTYALSSEDMYRIAEYSRERGVDSLSLWASEIPVNWYGGLNDFVVGGGDDDGCRWRQTGNCLATGPREPHNDKRCTATIDAGSSGYCECGDGRMVMAVDCGHPEFKCIDHC